MAYNCFSNPSQQPPLPQPYPFPSSSSSVMSLHHLNLFPGISDRIENKEFMDHPPYFFPTTVQKGHETQNPRISVALERDDQIQNPKINVSTEKEDIVQNPRTKIVFRRSRSKKDLVSSLPFQVPTPSNREDHIQNPKINVSTEKEVEIQNPRTKNMLPYCESKKDFVSSLPFEVRTKREDQIQNHKINFSTEREVETQNPRNKNVLPYHGSKNDFVSSLPLEVRTKREDEILNPKINVSTKTEDDIQNPRAKNVLPYCCGNKDFVSSLPFEVPRRKRTGCSRNRSSNDLKKNKSNDCSSTDLKINGCSSNDLKKKKSTGCRVTKEKFCMTLSQEQLEHDFLLITGSNQLPRPRPRPRPRPVRKNHKLSEPQKLQQKLQKSYLDSLFPGLRFREK